ncbi:FtsH protease activity modulator HflK [Ideonella livida]|uniref:Protein HflK n=1 Tax=Ideonella livida TaxID=2707176 RepID=A0A7C9THL0_9BURK|nr:FtsH protease activity modulator HflK [Ideonella livida]NDY90699.1 FtsH protease activity modulator HflK [Ideonella livida]
MDKLHTPDPLLADTASPSPPAQALRPVPHALRRLWQRGWSVLHNGRNDGPPDLDELWRDFNRKLNGLFGRQGAGGPGRSDEPPPEAGGGLPPDFKGARFGLGMIGGLVVLIWAGSGVFIVQEGQQAVITTFGKYSSTVGAGLQWRLPYPVQQHRTVAVTQLRTIEIGRSNIVAATGLRDSSMLTQDENIVDIRFSVQYRLKDARAFLFENRDPDEAVMQAAESAVREIVGRSKVDSVLYERRDAIAADLVKSIQNQMDRLNAGIAVANVNLQHVQVPEQVQAAFDDAVRAGADRDRFKNEGQAYASDVIPKAQGTAARLLEEAEGYRSRVVAQAEGDAQRFSSVLAEYQKAPGVTRDRLYLDTMQQVYANVTKVMVDSRSGSNLLYLPLDKLMQAGAPATPAPAVSNSPATPASGEPSTAASADARARDTARSRDRDTR